MAFGDHVQSASQIGTVAGSSVIVATLGGTATAGNLLVALGTVGATVTATITDNVSGVWTVAKTVEAASSATVWFKIAVGTETSVSYTPGASATRSLVVSEFTGPFDGVPHDSAAAVVSRGTSAAWAQTAAHSTAANGELCVAEVALRANTTGFTWTGSLTERYDDSTYHSTASAVITTAGTTPSATATLAGSSKLGASSLVCFKAAGGTNAAPTVNVGADVIGHEVDTLLSRTAVVADSDGSVVSTEWKVMSGPNEVTDVVESDASLAWTPSVTGTYVLRCTATDDDAATGFDEITVQVVPGGTVTLTESQETTGSTAANVVTLLKPGTAAEDKVLVAFIARNIGALTPPADWIQIAETQTGTSTPSLRVTAYYLVLTAAHDLITDWTWNLSAGRPVAGWIGCYNNTLIDNSDVVDDFGTSGSSTDSTTVTLPTVTTTRDGNVLIAAGVVNNATGTTTHTMSAPSGYHLLANTNDTPTSRVGLAVAEFQQALSDDSAAGAFTCDQAGDQVAILLSLNLLGGTPGNVAPTVNAGVDILGHYVNTQVSRTATVADSDGTVVSTTWTVVSGPNEVGNTIGVTTALTWTPSVSGTYSLGCTAVDNDDAATTDLLTVQVIEPPGGSGWYVWDGSDWNQIVGLNIWTGTQWVSE